MGYYSEMDIEMQDEEFVLSDDELQALDFDLRDADDSDWWQAQDAELEAEELAHIERLAEIQEYRTQGYM